MDRKSGEEHKSGVDRLKDALYSRQSGPRTDPNARTPLPRARERTPHTWEDIHPAEPVEVPHESAQPAAALPIDRTLPAGIARKVQAADAAESDLRVQSAREIMPRIPKPKKPRRSRLPLYFLMLALAFFFGAAGVAAFLFFQGANTISGSNIDLSISAPSLADSGKPATVQYVISNRNPETLKSTDLVVTYPAGTRSAGNLTQDLPQERISIGDIPPGGQVIKTSSAAFFGVEGAPQDITATLEYQLQGSNAIFTKDGSTSFIIGSAPVTISVSAPDEAISGQQFSADVTVASNASAPLNNVALQAEWPFGFSMASADPPPDVGGNLWRFGDLAPGQSKVVHLEGTLTGADGDARVFHFLAGSESDLTEASLKVPLITSPLTITVRKPFISSVISVAGKTGSTVAVPLGQGADGEIAWQNNLTTDAAHVSFTLDLSGAPLDPSSVVTNGFYDSSKSQIVWDEQTQPNLADVGPGAQGTLKFSFKTLPPSRTLVSNPHVDLALHVSAVRAAQGNVPETVTSAANMTVNLASAVTLTAAAQHFEGPFENAGPMPPVHSQPTSYTIVWSLKNSSNDIGNGLVSATLPPYVAFDKAASGSDVAYDAASRTVTWTLGDIAIGAGYSAPLRTAEFQVMLTPSVTQTGTIPNLTSDATFTGQDRFAGVQVTTTATAPTTRLTDDPHFVQGMEMVK